MTGSIDDDQWTRIKGAHYGDPDIEIEVSATGLRAEAVAIAETVAHLQAIGPVAEWAPPKSWIEYSRRVLDRRREEQVYARGLLRLPNEPLPQESVHDALVSAITAGQSGGCCEELRHWIYRANGERTTRATDVVAVCDGTPLYDFWKLVQDFSANYKVTPEEVVEFLLCDKPFVLPWIRATWDNQQRVTLVVGSTEVRPEEVAAAYSSARRSALRWLDSPAGSFAGQHSRYKRAADGHSDLVAFMESQLVDGGVTQHEAARRWLDANPDDPRQEDSVVRTYRRHRQVQP